MRVVDLFRTLDADASGIIDKSEFARAMARFGLHAPREAVDTVFDSFDVDR